MPAFFLAVTPPAAVTAPVEALRARWGNPHHRVEPHITVKIPFPWAPDPEGFLAPVRAACAGVAPFEARLGAPSRFAEAGVLYLSVAAPGLKPLHLAVMRAFAGLVAPDPRGHEGETYTPHLTLAVSRFGITAEGLETMEEEARSALAALPPFMVGALRCYRRERSADPWQPWLDIPLG